MNPNEISPTELLAMLSQLPPDDALILAARYGVEFSAAHAERPWLDDYLDGRFHRPNVLPEYTELQKRRWPPTGDRELWIRYGPTGPPEDDSDDRPLADDLDHPFLKRLAEAGLYPQKPGAAA